MRSPYILEIVTDFFSARDRKDEGSMVEELVLLPGKKRVDWAEGDAKMVW